MAETNKTTAADLAAAKAAWRQRCTESYARFTEETKRLIRQHAVILDQDERPAK